MKDAPARHRNHKNPRNARTPVKRAMKAAAAVAVSAGIAVANAAGAHLDSWQRAIVLDTSPMILWEKSRRIGADYAVAAKVVLDLISGVSSRHVWYAAHEESAAREWMEYVKHFAGTLGHVLEVATREEFIDGKKLLKFECEIPTPRGVRRVTAMTSNPGRFRSKGGDVILSELAFHEHAQQMYKAAAPATTRGGRIIILSSHNGVDSYFNELLEGARRIERGEGKPGDLPFKVHRTTIHDAVEHGLVETINRVEGTRFTREAWLAAERAKHKPEDWAEEFECQPSAEIDSYFPYALLTPCVNKDAPRPTESLPEFFASIDKVMRDADALFVGCDIGRVQDLFVLWAVAQRGGMRKLAGVLAWRGVSFPTMQAAGDALMQRWFCAFGGATGSRQHGVRVRRMCVDATGLGMQMGEHWKTAYRGRVEAIQVTAGVKEDLMPLLRASVEQNTIELPDDPIVLADFNSVRRVVTAAGNVRYAAEQTAQGHADFATAAYMALHAAETGKAVFRSAPSARGSW